MSWKRLSDYCIEMLPYSIFKAFVHGKPIYTLVVNKDVIGRFDSAKEAMDKAEEMKNADA